MNLREILYHFVGLIFPNLCCVCGENLLKGEEVLCTQCLFHIPRTNFHLQKENPIEKRFWGKVPVENVSAFFFFQKGSPYRNLLHELKYRNNPSIGHILGRYAASDLLESEHFRSFDYIVPVPLHPKKLKQRGYNQSEHIANGMAEVMNIPVEKNTLYRAIENPTQTKKSVYERWENTHGIFAVRNTETFTGKHILLVDDILTTGSTLIACTEAICQSKEAKVSIFTLATA